MRDREKEAHMTTVALIPTFRPDGTLFNTLAELRCRGIDRVVVDDGSGMEYRNLFRRATRDAIVLSYGVNHGKGHALKLGLRYIQEHYPTDTRRRRGTHQPGSAPIVHVRDGKRMVASCRVVYSSVTTSPVHDSMPPNS